MIFELDELDVTILQTLLLDARTSFSELAKITQTSTNTIRTRFNKMKKNGVITGATIQIKPKTLGHLSVGQIFILTDFNEEVTFCKTLLKIPGIVACHFQVGHFNYAAFFSLENVDQLDEVVTNVNQHPNIKRTSFDVCVDGFNTDHPRNLVIEPTKYFRTNKTNLISEYLKEKAKEVRKQQINNLVEILNLDKIDYDILDLLLKDSRMSFRKIAQKLSVSNQSIIRRYNELRKSVIYNSTITINLEKVGYFGLAIFRLRLSTDYPASIIFKKIIDRKNVIIAYRTIGDFQILVGMPFKKMDELISHFKDIKKILGVKDVQLFLHKPFPKWPVNTFSRI